MTQDEYMQRELHLAMMAMVTQNSDKVKVYCRNNLFTLFQFGYPVTYKNQTVTSYQYFKCFKN